MDNEIGHLRRVGAAMSSETRVVRPFKSADKTQDWINENLSIELVSGASVLEKLNPGSTSRIDANSLISCSPLLTGINENLYEAVMADATNIGGLNPENLRLLVVIKSSYLKQVSLISEYSIEEIRGLSNSIPLNDELFRCVHHGWEVSILLVLSKSSIPQPGVAWRRGTWLARADFLVASPTEGLGFTPRALTEEIRAHYELSQKTTRYAQVVDGMSILDGATVDSVLEYYVDETLLQRLSASPTSPFSILEQTRIFLDAASFVVTEACRDSDFRGKQVEDVKDSVVHKFLILLAGDNKAAQQSWLAVWQESPAKIIAQIEAHANLAEKIEKVMAGVE